MPVTPPLTSADNDKHDPISDPTVPPKVARVNTIHPMAALSTASNPSSTSTHAPTTGINPKDLVGAQKVPLSLIPSTALMDLALALQTGAIKYGPFNWRKIPVQMHVYLEAAIGHLESCKDGEDYDQESTLHHVAHAMACCAIILDGLHTGLIKDTRPTKDLPGLGSFSRDPQKVLSSDPAKVKELLSQPWKQL